jgi:hypothetical protein
MIEFDECGNYRGSLQAKKEDGKFYWRVDCDVDYAEWIEIPDYLWLALKRYHEQTSEKRMQETDDDADA